MLPIYQREAMWLAFNASEPTALQVGVGKVCAVSGLPWIEHLVGDPQNYVALPRQPWLDGINAGDGFIRQFVAVHLGSGATVEGQVTGEETHGGLQLRAVGLTEQALAEWLAAQALRAECCEDLMDGAPVPAPSASMGLGAGGRMRQEVYADDRPLADYDESGAGRVFVHLCSAAQWTAIIGEVPPPTPVDRDAYVGAGLPWFDYYDADARKLAPSENLTKVESVGKKLGAEENPFVSVDPKTVIAPGGVSPDSHRREVVVDLGRAQRSSRRDVRFSLGFPFGDGSRLTRPTTSSIERPASELKTVTRQLSSAAIKGSCP
jgi:hypothetical protein